MYSIYEIAILKKRRSKNIFCTIRWICILITPFQFCIAQSSWELTMLRDINPQQPNSGAWKAFSTTAKPLSVAIPVGLMTAALLNKDADTKQKAIEIAVRMILKGYTIDETAEMTGLLKEMVSMIQENVKEGKKQKASEIATRLLRKGISVEEVAEDTELTVEEVSGIHEKMND